MDSELSEMEIKKAQYPEIELTELEIATALAMARQQKFVENNKAKFLKTINSEKKFDIPNSTDFKNQILIKIKKIVDKNLIITPAFDEVVTLLSYYFTNDEKFEQYSFNNNKYSLNKGIALWGGKGVGKTTIMQAFQINPKLCFDVVQTSKIKREFQKNGWNGIDYLFNLQRDYDYLYRYGNEWKGHCLNDIGIEEYNQFHYNNQSNVIADIIYERYETRVPAIATHLTFNLTAIELEERYNDRIVDRLREMFNFICFPASEKSLRVG